MRLSTFPSSFFQNTPTNFTGLSEEECPRDWRSAFSKMEKTDGRQDPLYSLFYSEHLGWKEIITINPGNSSGEAYGRLSPNRRCWETQTVCFRHEQETVVGNENEGLCLCWSCVIFVVFLIPSKHQEGSRMISLIKLFLEMRS